MLNTLAISPNLCKDQRSFLACVSLLGVADHKRSKVIPVIDSLHSIASNDYGLQRNCVAPEAHEILEHYWARGLVENRLVNIATRITEYWARGVVVSSRAAPQQYAIDLKL